jgi:hypothetical protein
MERYIPPKRRLTFNWLHNVLPQKIMFFNSVQDGDIVQN